MNGVSAEALPADTISYDANTRCIFDTVKSQYAQNVATSGSYVQFSTSTILSEGKTYANQCMLSTDEGLYATTGMWSPTGDKTKIMPIESVPYVTLPLPGGGFIVRDGSGPGGFYYSINKKLLKDAGHLAYKTYGSGLSQKKELTWRVDTSKIAEFYTYADHSLVRFDELAVSNNGDFAVGSIYQRGVVKVDLRSGTMTPLSNATFSNGVGLFMSISNDGRYAMTTKTGSGRLMIYDTQGCATSYPANAWSRSDIFTGVGCIAKDMYADIRSQVSNMTNLSGLHFTNSAEVEVFIYRTVSGVTQSQRFRLSAQGYSSTARGYLALGDSFASGEGDTDGETWYEQGTDEQGNENTFVGRNLCHLSRRSYPYLMAVELGYLTTNTAPPPDSGLFHSVACSGAKMHNLLGILGEKQDEGNASDFAITDNQYRYGPSFSMELWQPGYSAQHSYTKEKVKGDVYKPAFNPEVITMSIGGNDAGFGQKLLACLLPGTCEFASDQSVRSEVAKELAAERKNLVKVYKKVKEEAPEARVYVVGYPKFVQASSEPCGANVHLNNDEATFVNFATAYYNDVIQSAAAVAGVVYVDVEEVLVNVNLCSGAPQSQMAVNGVTAGNDVSLSPVSDGLLKHGLCILRNCVGNETFHPNQNGHKLYKERIISATAALTTQNPTPVVTNVPLPSDYFGVEARSFIDGLNGAAQNPQNYAEMQEMVSGALDYRQPTITLKDMLPNSTVRFEVHSEPVNLGVQTASSNGVLQFSAMLPAGLAPGYHEIHAYGFDEFGNPVHYYDPIMVGAVEGDFDGDGVEDIVDSCPTIINSGVDTDEDGIDDVCDGALLARLTETPADEGTPTPEEETPQEEVSNKGAPSVETVAGNEQTVSEGAVLGASTASTVKSVLSSTGVNIAFAVFAGWCMVIPAVYLLKRPSSAIYHIHKK